MEEGPTGSKTIIREYKFGDVTLHFPRWGGDDTQRGGYIVGIKWFLDITEGEDFLTRGNLGKEYPHNTYGPRSFERRFFLQDRFRFRDQPNPDPSLDQALDGNWHSFLAVIFNDYYLGSQVIGKGLPSPTIGLWYSHVPTFRYRDFQFIGMSIDKRGMEGDETGSMYPNGPLLNGIEHSNIHWGDKPFTPEHPLQIRIDDVSPDQIEIRNVYAADVIYHGAIPPPNPPRNCVSRARAVNDAQLIVDDLRSSPVSLKRTCQTFLARHWRTVRVKLHLLLITSFL